ncbi:hypothetical protein STEG23_025670, partial [Scotinomys teguina]
MARKVRKWEEEEVVRTSLQERCQPAKKKRCRLTVPKSQKQWSTSFIPKTAMLSTFNNFPWIVSIDETCQGIMLNQWWVLSTISCITKLYSKVVLSSVPLADIGN